ncbi:hypothetical protein BDV19DRAFT_360728 [Aspergillus venezuelensis]
MSGFMSSLFYIYFSSVSTGGFCLIFWLFHVYRFFSSCSVFTASCLPTISFLSTTRLPFCIVNNNQSINNTTPISRTQAQIHRSPPFGSIWLRNR